MAELPWRPPVSEKIAAPFSCHTNDTLFSILQLSQSLICNNFDILYSLILVISYLHRSMFTFRLLQCRVIHILMPF